MGRDVFPATSDGEITILGSGQQQFIRGDADGDGIFNGLNDALNILTFQFAGGSPPPCMEAAEADGNGSFNGLNDSL